MNNSSLSLVIGGSGVTQYRYKIGLAGATDCSSATGYSANTPIATPLTYDLLTFADGASVTLCVVGVDASGNVQSYANATNHTWRTKDTTAPTAPTNFTVSDTNFYYTHTTPFFTWTASTDNNLAGYQIAIGTNPGATNVTGWISVGNVTSTQMNLLGRELNLDTTYYATLRALDLAGQTTPAASGVSWTTSCTGTMWCNQEAYLKAPNAEAQDRFGSSLSISGDTIVVGARDEDSNQTTITNGLGSSSDNSATDSGAAYVFRRSGATWTQEAYLKAPNAEAGDTFGTSLSISGDTIVVGAIGEDSNQTTITNGSTASADNLAAISGAAYVFRRSGSTWSHEAYLKAPNAGATDYFGMSVSISGDTIVVGARDEDSNQTTITNGLGSSSDNSATDSGAAYVFRRSGATWTREAYLKAPNAEAGDTFGTSLSISGDTIVVGAYAEDSNQTTITNGSTASTDNSVSASGAAYVFRRSGATWTHEAYLKAPNAEGYDYFGTSLSISGDTIVVGTYYEDSNQTTITNGSTASTNNSATSSGAAYVFRRSGSTWTHEAYLKAPNAGANDQFGYRLSVSGDTIVVGANYEDSNQTTITNGSTASSDNSASASGAAYVFRRSGSTWTHEAYLKAPNAEVNDQFGFSTSISGDTIVVGAICESSNQTSITNGITASPNNSSLCSGAAYVFRYTTPTDGKTVTRAEIEYTPSGGEDVQIQVQYSDDNSAWTTAHTFSVSGAGALTYNQAWSRVSTQSGSHRYWRLNFTDPSDSCVNGAIAIGEVRMYLADDDKVALAAKTILSSSFTNSANATDANSATSAVWSGACSGTIDWDFGP